MKFPFKDFLITTLLSVGSGCVATALVVNSDNGYAAGFVFFPLLVLIVLSCIVLIIVGVISMAAGKNFGPWIVLAGPLLVIGFFGSAATAKYLELGGYHEDPMVPMTPPVTNIVLFKKDVTNDQINQFWDETLSTSRPDGRGRDHLPGLQGIGRLGKYEGHDVVEFSFFESATEDQRQYVYDRVAASPFVAELRKNVPSKDYMSEPDRLTDKQSQNSKKAITTDSPTPSH